MMLRLAPCLLRGFVRTIFFRRTKMSDSGIV